MEIKDILSKIIMLAKQDLEFHKKNGGDKQIKIETKKLHGKKFVGK